VKYAFIDRHRRHWPVSALCEQLNVSPSAYHRHRRRKAAGTGRAGRVIGNDLLLAQIKAVHAQSRGEYGWPRVWRQLQANGVAVGKERTRRLMQQHGIRARTKRKFKATTDSRHNLPVAPNLIARDFSPPAPNRVWATDITYIATDEGWLYLTAMLDLFSRQVVGWSLQPRMSRHLVIDALRMAWFRRRPAPGLIIHSDRGSQYCSGDFQAALKAYGIRSSMSRKANCWDNAPTESLWASLKRASVYGQRFTTRDEARAAVMNWLAFYNASRLHSTLGYVSPMQFEKNWQAEQVKKSA